MDVSSYMMKTEGEDNKIEETEDLELLEERAFAAEQSHEHTGGTKPDEDDQYEHDNKKQRVAESNSTLITGTIRQMRALSNTQKSRLFWGRRLIYLVLAFFATPGQWQYFIPFQSKGKFRPRNSLFQSNTAYIFLTIFLTLKFSRPTVFSQSMSSTNLKWLFCLPNFCRAQMAICPMRYVAVLLCSRAA